MIKHNLALAALALCTARAARCEEDYGGQIAVIDAISLGVGFAGIAVRSSSRRSSSSRRAAR